MPSSSRRGVVQPAGIPVHRCGNCVVAFPFVVPESTRPQDHYECDIATTGRSRQETDVCYRLSSQASSSAQREQIEQLPSLSTPFNTSSSAARPSPAVSS